MTLTLNTKNTIDQQKFLKKCKVVQTHLEDMVVAKNNVSLLARIGDLK